MVQGVSDGFRRIGQNQHRLGFRGQRGQFDTRGQPAVAIPHQGRQPV